MVEHEGLELLITANRCITRTAEVVGASVSKPRFYSFVRDMGLEQVSRGVYATQDAWIDAMFLFSLRSRQAVFSHETALCLPVLTDRERTRHSVTAKTGYSAAQLKVDGVAVDEPGRTCERLGPKCARESDRPYALAHQESSPY